MDIPVKDIKIIPMPNDPKIPFRSGDWVEGPDDLGDGIVVGFDLKESKPCVFFYSQQQAVRICCEKLKRLPFINVGSFLDFNTGARGAQRAERG